MLWSHVYFALAFSNFEALIVSLHPGNEITSVFQKGYLIIFFIFSALSKSFTYTPCGDMLTQRPALTRDAFYEEIGNTF